MSWLLPKCEPLYRSHSKVNSRCIYRPKRPKSLEELWEIAEGFWEKAEGGVKYAA